MDVNKFLDDRLHVAGLAPDMRPMRPLRVVDRRGERRPRADRPAAVRPVVVDTLPAAATHEALEFNVGTDYLPVMLDPSSTTRREERE
jgi:hypothetical protein